MPSGEFGGIGAGVTIRRLFALLVAMAISLAPVGMPAMAVAQDVPASQHHGDMAGPMHCDEQQPDGQQPEGDQNCCAAMCFGVVVPQGGAPLAAYHGPTDRPARDRFRLGYLGEIATPPPRFS